MPRNRSTRKTTPSQSSPTPETNENGIHDPDSPYFLNSRSFDGTASRQPGDDKLILDRAFMNWNNIGGSPGWLSIGRRPTTDGPIASMDQVYLTFEANFQQRNRFG